MGREWALGSGGGPDFRAGLVGSCGKPGGWEPKRGGEAKTSAAFASWLGRVGQQFGRVGRGRRGGDAAGWGLTAVLCAVCVTAIFGVGKKKTIQPGRGRLVIVQRELFVTDWARGQNFSPRG